MGHYIAVDELEERIGTTACDKIVAGKGFTAGSADAESFLEGVIGRAEDLVDGYCGKIYTLPLPISSLVKEWALRFSEYELYKAGAGDQVPVKYKDSYNEALAQIKDCLKGELKPVGFVLARNTPGNSLVVASNDALFTMRTSDDKPNFSLF